MFRHLSMICTLLALGVSAAPAADVAQASGNVSGAQIADRNVAARGGLQAWRAVQTMSLRGKLAAGGNQRATLDMPGKNAAQKLVSSRPAEEVQLPFVMELKRPRKMRFELQFNGQTAVQVFDGVNGWKLRPFLNRRVVEAYTAEEMKIASAQADLDGLLVDYAAKGTRVDLAGSETIEGRDTYKLKLTMRDGQTRFVWIDSQDFLEVKIEGQPRRLDGVYHPVEIYFRDYRLVNGLQIPFGLETKVLPVAQTAAGLKDVPVPSEKTVIERVVINPRLDESRFSKPVIEVASNTPNNK